MATTEFSEYPWAKRNRYMRPCLPMEGDTVYKSSFLNNCEDARRCNYKRPGTGDILEMGFTTDGLTVYATSYEPTEGHLHSRQMPSVVPVDHIGLPAGEMSCDTVNKTSYPGWVGILPSLPATPLHGSRLMGHGPMTSMTTNRLDFTAKTSSKVSVHVPEDGITLPVDPIDGRTTSQMSYKEPDLRCFKPPLSYRPQHHYMPSEAPTECDTINRLSYTGAQPCQRIVIAARYRPPLPPLTEEERALVCDPGTGNWVPKPAPKKASIEQPDDPCLEPRMDISRPRENPVPLIENIKVQDLVLDQKTEARESSEEDEAAVPNETSSVPSFPEALYAYQTSSRYLTNVLSDEEMCVVTEYGRILYSIHAENAKQSTITDYCSVFKK